MIRPHHLSPVRPTSLSSGGASSILTTERLGIAEDSRSYPNQIPLSAAEVTRVCRPLESYEFDKIFGAFEGLNVYDHGKSKIMQSRDVIVQRLATT